MVVRNRDSERLSGRQWPSGGQNTSKGKKFVTPPAVCRVGWLKITDISGTISVPIIRVRSGVANKMLLRILFSEGGGVAQSI
jgi:hypothetical protein